jgi:UDP-2,4-diacetamido-2,4,6-trideoxy-beta-L-altropyranose hydrolase
LKANGVRLNRITVDAGSTADALATIKLARDHGAKWLVVDGYHFDYEYQQMIKEQGLRLLVIDDFGHAERYVADLILNQNIYAAVDLYRFRSPSTRLLLGTRYALLRSEFWHWQGWQRPISARASRILVTLGGGDANNATLRVIETIQPAVQSPLEAIIVVGGGNPHRAELKKAIRDDSRFRLVQNVDNISELMAWADVAISAAGSTCWELAFMGLPALLIVLAENQRPAAEDLDRLGCCVNLGWFHELAAHQLLAQLDSLIRAKSRRQVMSKAGKELVDGLGSHRVVNRLLESEKEFSAFSEGCGE